MDHTKMNPKYLDYPRRKLSVRGLGCLVALLVRSGIIFSCACTGMGVQSSCWRNSTSLPPPPLRPNFSEKKSSVFAAPAGKIPFALRKRGVIIFAVSSCVRKTTQKYGIGIPTSLDNATRMRSVAGTRLGNGKIS